MRTTTTAAIERQEPGMAEAIALARQYNCWGTCPVCEDKPRAPYKRTCTDCETREKD